MSRTVRTSIRCPAARCYELFCDVNRLVEWVPGLESVIALRHDEEDRPIEVRFRATLAGVGAQEYTLLYAHDAPRRRIAWMPGEGSPWAVRGFASFDEQGADCEMIYSLDIGDGRDRTPETQLAEARAAVASFKRWVEASR